MIEEKQKKVRKYNVGKKSSRTMRSATLDNITGLYERFCNYKQTEGMSQRTIKDYKSHFNYLMEFLDHEDITRGDMTKDLFREYISWMLYDRGLSPVTVNVRMRTLRAFLRFCYKEGYIQNPIHEDLKILKTPQDLIESFTVEEIRKLLSVIDKESYAGFRDALIIQFLLDTMVRVSEMVAIRRENVHLDDGFIKLEATETKTRRARLVPLSLRTIEVLNEYMKETKEYENEFLFLTYEGVQLSADTVRWSLRQIGQAAGITNKRVSPHTFRHTGALMYIMNGGDPFSLQKILGHSHMNMVRKYIQMTDMDVKEQHDLFSPLNRIF
ncbi:tyrosine-type recombinase/integrase [Niallia endozanthoxylica]|uniref:Tyrosine-type recombinase/integrase n=1 Tax=Niallia endozanthoxylica TaxID=2036016 RepID=A0A5J5GW67_9BACI|nr:tyrosine-type recombinase/integrase [Niallia endozanthoxylica]KAA9012405.1 tyrosine-type recombinase/integrase [Niallia endozanthoxylica]